MSWYTAGEIFVWLLIAAILGFILGWLIKGLLSRGSSGDDSAELKASLKKSRELNAKLESDLKASQEAGAELETNLQKCRENRVQLEADLRQAREVKATAPDTTARTIVGAPVSKPAAARERVVEIARRTAGDGENPKDDLVEVHGIGEVISKMLYSMDITSFRQIARFEAEDIAIVSDALEVFPDRIERDDWMSSARELHIAKYGVDPLA